MNNLNIIDWTVNDVIDWANREHLDDVIINCIKCEKLSGKCILTLSEFDLHELRSKCNNCNLKLGHVKLFWLSLRNLQRDNNDSLIYLGFHIAGDHPHQQHHHSQHHHLHHNHHLHYNGMMTGGGGVHHGMMYRNGHHLSGADMLNFNDIDRISPPMSVDGRAVCLQPEFFKTMISLGYAFLVTWITAFVMVVVHERVPDMKRYPPLPDIFLDNVPHIPWAFHMCEVTGTFLFCIWLCVLVVHKHRMVLLRRFFALGGTVFLLRCFTMLITSLSVPGTHLQCTPHDYEIDDENMAWFEAISLRISRAYYIWSGLGMSIQGVRTCGDYMFSGHTVALTTLNFFITEYTPRHLYFLHTMTWLLNMFGIFFILAAHEHYSIDVFVAFYITSRLFLYYHTLANNQALMSRDSNRTRIWFPMFSYFESSVDGIIPNEYDTIDDVIQQLFSYLVNLKDVFMLTARRIWLPPTDQKKTGEKKNSVPNSPKEIHLHGTINTPINVTAATPTTPNNDDKNNLNMRNQNLNMKKMPETINLLLKNNEIRTASPNELVNLSDKHLIDQPTDNSIHNNVPVMLKKDN